MPASGNNENTDVINMQLDQNHVNLIARTNLLHNNNYLHTENKESKLNY